ncbi:hypothetical protein C8Q78DRAFT_836853 [Trametes maxima]|nr:hypothetical protein C8Q78DRAFT_836853 [Trametes maxima]
MSLPLHSGQPLTANQAACWLRRLIEEYKAGVARLPTCYLRADAQEPTHEKLEMLSTHAGVLEQMLDRMCFFLPDLVVRAVVAIIVAARHQAALIDSADARPDTPYILDAERVATMIAYLERVEARLLSDARWVQSTEGQDLLRVARRVDLKMHASRAAFAKRMYCEAGQGELADFPVADGREGAWEPLYRFLEGLQGLPESDAIDRGYGSLWPDSNGASTSAPAGIPRPSPEVYSPIAWGPEADDAPSPSPTACTEAWAPQSMRQFEKSRSRSYEPSSTTPSLSPPSSSSSSASSFFSTSSRSSPYSPTRPASPPIHSQRLPFPSTPPNAPMVNASEVLVSSGSRKRRRSSEEHQPPPIHRKRTCVQVRFHGTDSASPSPSRPSRETQPTNVGSYVNHASPLRASSNSSGSDIDTSASGSSSGAAALTRPSSLRGHANASSTSYKASPPETISSSPASSTRSSPSSIRASNSTDVTDDEDVQTVSDDMDACSFVTTDDGGSWNEYVVYDPATAATSVALDDEDDFDTRRGRTSAPAPVHRSKDKRRCCDGFLQTVRQFFIH